jgi:hypothetical protein
MNIMEQDAIVPQPDNNVGVPGAQPDVAGAQPDALTPNFSDNLTDSPDVTAEVSGIVVVPPDAEFEPSPSGEDSTTTPDFSSDALPTTSPWETREAPPTTTEVPATTEAPSTTTLPQPTSTSEAPPTISTHTSDALPTTSPWETREAPPMTTTETSPTTTLAPSTTTTKPPISSSELPLPTFDVEIVPPKDAAEAEEVAPLDDTSAEPEEEGAPVVESYDELSDLGLTSPTELNPDDVSLGGETPSGDTSENDSSDSSIPPAATE